jgi:hypothetical protein
MLEHKMRLKANTLFEMEVSKSKVEWDRQIKILKTALMFIIS